MSWPLLPPSYERQHGHAERIELAGDRRIRERNKINYRLAHWPIWIFVFFIAPGPLTFDLFAHGFDSRMALWLTVVLVATGIAGIRGIDGDAVRIGSGTGEGGMRTLESDGGDHRSGGGGEPP